MPISGLFKTIAATAGIFLAGFVVFSLLDVVLAVLQPRFYSTAAFITVFGVGGIFAGLFSYTLGIEYAGDRKETGRIYCILTVWLLSLVFFFLLARLEGREYAAAFRAYAVTAALSVLLMLKGKP